MQLKRVSSDEIKRNYTQTTGREALERLLAGEEIFSVERLMSWKIIGESLHKRNYNDSDCDSVRESELYLNTFLTKLWDNDWYVAPPFDARKEMLARPGEWVAKYERFYGWAYIGFDHAEMVVVGSGEIGQNVNHIDAELAVMADEIDRSIPLDDADLAKLASLSKEGE